MGKEAYPDFDDPELIEWLEGPNKEKELTELEMLRREHDALLLVLDERFRRLEELIEANEQQTALLITGYFELAGNLDALLRAIEGYGDEDVFDFYKEYAGENRKQMIKIMEQMGVRVDPAGPDSNGSVEDVAD